MPTFHIIKKKFKKFGFCKNWFWCPEHGHYGFIWLFRLTKQKHKNWGEKMDDIILKAFGVK